MRLDHIPNDLMMKEKIPLCVDLDGTLIKSDIFWESLRILVMGNMLYLFILPFWLLHGKAFVKGQVSKRVSFDLTALPYHPAFLDFILSERKAGRSLILATGTHRRMAIKIAKHLKCFDQVFASSDSVNLTGRKKSQALIKQFGKGGFDYAGNSKVDLPIWENANSAIIVNGSQQLIEAVKKVSTVQAIFP